VFCQCAYLFDNKDQDGATFSDIIVFSPSIDRS
jgi:hypothetical protein